MNPCTDRILLGDRIQNALSFVGMTKKRVEAWLGGPCGCDERREMLNQLELWARRVLRLRSPDSKDRLEEIIGAT